MSGRGRWWLLGLLLVLGGLVAALLLGPRLLDQERYRGILTSRAGQLLNRHVTVRGLHVRLLPTPGITVQGVRIADRPPWSEPFLDAEQVYISLKLLPLLRGELQIGNIRIDRPSIRVARGPDGWNLDDLIRPAARGGVTDSRRAEGMRAAKAQPTLPGLMAGALAIRHGDFILENPLHPYGPASLELKDINLDIPTQSPSSPLRLHVSGQLPGKTSGSFDLVGSVQRHEGDRLPIEITVHAQGLEAAQLASVLGLSHASSIMAFSGTLDLEAKAAGEWPHLDLQAAIDLQQVGVTFPGSTQAGTGTEENGKAPGDKAWLRAKGRWESDRLDLSEMNLLWKGQTTTGRLHLATQKSPRLQFWLTTPDLSVDSLVAIATEVGTGADPSLSRRSSPLTPRTMSFFKVPASAGQSGGLQVEGHLRSGALRWGKLALTNAEGDLRYCCGLLTISRLQGGFYGGNLSGEAALSFSKQTPHTKIVTHLEGVQTEPFLKAMWEPQWTLHGVMTLDSTLEIVGPLGPGALTRTSGQTDMILANGRMLGYAPLERVSKTVNPILKEVGLPSPTLNEFDRLSAHWTLDGGMLRTRDLALLRDGAKFFAVGSVNLLTQVLDFDVTAKVAKTTLEAKLQGTSSDLVVTPQVGRIEQRIKTEVSRFLGDERNKALGKALRQLFSR